MKTLKKIALFLLIAMLALSVCGAVFAEGSAGASEEPAETAAETATEAASSEEPAATEAVKHTLTLRTYDENGKEVRDMSGMSCLSAMPNLYIKHAYKVVFGYSEGSSMEETDDEIILDVVSENEGVTREHNTVFFPASDKPYKATIKIADPAQPENKIEVPVSVKRFNLGLTDIIVAFIAVYVLINVFSGKGALFNDEFIKEDKKPLFKKLTRILACVTGVMFLLAAVLAICFSYLDWVRIARYVLFGIGLAALIAAMILNTVFTDKEKKQKAQATALTGGNTSSAAAFEFDENEPTVDEVLAEIEKKKNEPKSEN